MLKIIALILFCACGADVVINDGSTLRGLWTSLDHSARWVGNFGSSLMDTPN